MNTLTKSENRAANGRVPEQRGCISPHVDILETKEGYLLEAAMAGVVKDGLELTVEREELRIVGKRRANVEGAEMVYRECSPLRFKRVFDLDPAIDAGKITAATEQGVLTVNLPKAEKVKPPQIAVSG